MQEAKSHVSLDLEEQISFQIFIKTPDVKSSLIWVQEFDNISQMSQNIKKTIGLFITSTQFELRW